MTASEGKTDVPREPGHYRFWTQLGHRLNFTDRAFAGSRVCELTEINYGLSVSMRSCCAVNPEEIPMRILALAILAIGTVSIGPAAAQKYDPAYPVCLHAYGLAGFNYYDCSYTSLPQCNASASGRAAECVINPYFAGAEEPRDRHYRRHPRVY